MCESSILAVLSQIVCDNVVKIPRLRIVAAIKEAIELLWFLFFFSSRRRHTRCSRDWSSDVCSSDLADRVLLLRRERRPGRVVDLHRHVLPAVDARLAAHAQEVGVVELGLLAADEDRSEERRVGKECRSGWSPEH